MEIINMSGDSFYVIERLNFMDKEVLELRNIPAHTRTITSKM